MQFMLLNLVFDSYWCARVVRVTFNMTHGTNNDTSVYLLLTFGYEVWYDVTPDRSVVVNREFTQPRDHPNPNLTPMGSPYNCTIKHIFLQKF